MIPGNAEIEGAVRPFSHNKLQDRYCKLGDPGRKLLERAAEKMALSPRGVHRVLKVARTLADLDGEANIADPHLAEAIAYRSPINRRQSA